MAQSESQNRGSRGNSPVVVSQEDQSSVYAGHAPYVTKPMFLEQDTVRIADGTVDLLLCELEGLNSDADYCLTWMYWATQGT